MRLLWKLLALRWFVCLADELAPQGPVFTQEPANLVFPLDSEDRILRLVCEAQGHPKPVTRWRVNGTLLDEAQDYRYRVLDRSLIISNPDRERDVGTFQCEASNSLGTILSREAYLQFACVFCYPPCGVEQHVSAIEGKNVILKVDKQEFSEISWVFNTAHIATTKPNSTIEIKSRDYKSKLYTEKTSSLGISKAEMNNSGIFVASIFMKEDECSQIYNLTVYSTFTSRDLQILHNLTEDQSCLITCIVNKPDVATTWRSKDTGYREVTSTLHLDNRTMNISWVCTAANKLINASKTIEPWTLCYDGTKKNNRLMIVIVVCVLLIILAAVSACCLKKIKVKTKLCSICENKQINAAVDKDLQNEMFYYEIPKKEASPAVTVGKNKKKPVEKRATEGPVKKQVSTDPVYNTIEDLKS